MVLAIVPTVLCRGSPGLDSARQGLVAASFGPRPKGEARVVAMATLLLWSQAFPAASPIGKRGNVGVLVPLRELPEEELSWGIQQHP